MGKYWVAVSDRAKKDSAAIKKSGQKAVIHKVERIFWNFRNIRTTEQDIPNRCAIDSGHKKTITALLPIWAEKLSAQCGSELSRAT